MKGIADTLSDLTADLRLFARRNPKPCPVLDVTESGGFATVAFERALLADGVPVRHLEQGRNVPMFVTSLAWPPSGRLRGPLVVSMRPIPAALVATAVEVTARYPAVHGAPVHVGDPAALGVTDLSRPDFGDPLTVAQGEVPVFWACGVTPQAAVMASRPPFAISHAPGHMPITRRARQLLPQVSTA